MSGKRSDQAIKLHEVSLLLYKTALKFSIVMYLSISKLMPVKENNLLPNINVCGIVLVMYWNDLENYFEPINSDTNANIQVETYSFTLPISNQID